MNKNHGFTLIELMITVAIIAILSAIAIPAYQDYLVRAQVAEGLTLATTAKSALLDYYNDRGVFPTTNAQAGLGSATSITGNYVRSVRVGNADGSIRVTFGTSANAKIAGQELVLTADTTGGAINWDCGGIDRRYLPSPCG